MVKIGWGRVLVVKLSRGRSWPMKKSGGWRCLRLPSSSHHHLSHYHLTPIFPKMSITSLLAFVLLVFILIVLVLLFLIRTISYEVIGLTTSIAKSLFEPSLSITIGFAVAFLLHKLSKISNHKYNLHIEIFFST